MSDRTNGDGGPSWRVGDAPAGDRPGAGEPLAGVHAAQAGMELFYDQADGTVAWGEPVKHGGTLLLPASEVLTVAGFGVGSGAGEDGSRDGGPSHRGGGGGGGGGGKVLVRAVAVVEAGPDGVRVRPVVDVTKIALAALTAFGFVAAGWLGLKSPLETLRRLRQG